ncbi:hypothetical protein PUN28_012507 [Cardiocondyla obscurior]|uniref:Uncharacterized protein n=1 Tax=Cardiocondyla obscurior TaxID=286306 RepID=A0AAW2FEC2_9HYME
MFHHQRSASRGNNLEKSERSLVADISKKKQAAADLLAYTTVAHFPWLWSVSCPRKKDSTHPSCSERRKRPQKNIVYDWNNLKERTERTAGGSLILFRECRSGSRD